MSRRPSKATRACRARVGMAFAAVSALGLAAGVPAIAASKPAEGSEMLVTGVVTGGDGTPVAGVSVELVASRRAFSLRDFRIGERGRKVVAATTDEAGSFEIAWEWHPYYNRFELLAGVRVGRPGGETELVVLEQMDLAFRMRQGSPVVATFELADTSLADSMRSFLAILDTPDERRVYREMGKPDKVRQTRVTPREEIAWWYFAAGRAYWFLDGEVDSIDEFEPIPRLDE